VELIVVDWMDGQMEGRMDDVNERLDWTDRYPQRHGMDMDD
jgi:hypothetical protein